MSHIKRKYIWDGGVRLTHWVNALSLIVFAVTGVYIGAPYLHAINSSETVMANMRYYHFVAGYIFLFSVLVRILWFFIGNKYAGIGQWLPLSGERISGLFESIKFYLFISDRPPHNEGHTVPAGLSYAALYVMFLFEIASGFALYYVAQPTLIAGMAGGWMLGMMDLQTIRVWHYVVMWFILVFFMIHIYISWWMDTVERNGIMGSIFGGYKFFKH